VSHRALLARSGRDGQHFGEDFRDFSGNRDGAWQLGDGQDAARTVPAAVRRREGLVGAMVIPTYPVGPGDPDPMFYAAESYQVPKSMSTRIHYRIG